MSIPYGNGLRPFTPPTVSTASGWRNGAITFKSTPKADPQLAQKISVERAREIIDMLDADRIEANALPNAQPLASQLNTLFAQRGSVFDLYRAKTPTFAEAERAFDEAKANLVLAEGALARGSLDRDESLRLVADLEHARAVIRHREKELSAALSLRNGTYSRLGDAYPLSKPGSPRELAKKNVQRIVDEARSGGIDAVEMPAEVAVRIWEPLWAARAITAYEPGDGLPLEALKAAFDVRFDPDGARRLWLKERMAKARKGVL